jgi:threonine dehydratase
MVTLADVQAAREAVARAVRQTPVFTSSLLSERLGVRLIWKAELFQKTGSFKPRGALNRLRNTPRADLDRGIITVSAGNHAQGLAWAAREVGAACTVVMPATAARSKIAATEGYGATVVLAEGGVNAAFEKMEELRSERGLLLVHPFDDPLIIAGQGTVGLEILEQVPEVDVIVCPIGGGGLIAGVALTAKSLKPSVKVYGVEPEGASAMRQSWDRGEAVRLESVNTIADGLAAPMAGNLNFAITREYLDDVLLVSDAEIVEGMRALLTFGKLYAEPAGAAATAALLAGKIPVTAGQTVVAIVSGGNVDVERLCALLG